MLVRYVRGYIKDLGTRWSYSHFQMLCPWKIASRTHWFEGLIDLKTILCVVTWRKVPALSVSCDPQSFSPQPDILLIEPVLYC